MDLLSKFMKEVEHLHGRSKQIAGISKPPTALLVDIWGDPLQTSSKNMGPWVIERPNRTYDMFPAWDNLPDVGIFAGNTLGDKTALAESHLRQLERQRREQMGIPLRQTVEFFGVNQPILSRPGFSPLGYPVLSTAPRFWDFIKSCPDPTGASLAAKDMLEHHYDYICYPEDFE